MAVTITAGPVALTPDLINGYDTTRTGRTIVHDIIGAYTADVTLRFASLRTGTLHLVYTSANAENDSDNALAALATAVVFTLTVDDVPTAAMSFVVPAGGRITRTLDDTTRAAWTVDLDYQEVRS